MEQLINAYKIIKSLPLTNLNEGAIIKKINNKFYFQSIEIPYLTDELIELYCIPIQIFQQEIPLNQTVYILRASKKNEHVKLKCKIDGFNEMNGQYCVRPEKHNICRWVTKNEIIVPKLYYFLSSKGIIQQDYTYRDEEAEKWRKAIGNFFETKEACKEYKEKILSSVAQ